MTIDLCENPDETHAACGFPAVQVADITVTKVEFWKQETVSTY